MPTKTDTPFDLLDAVDALTKPVVLARFTSSDHDHDWLALVRPTTPEERATAKKNKTKEKLPRTLPTGEWWCPWCDLVVNERPDADPALRINRLKEQPLLDQLHDRIQTTLGDTGTRGANTGSSPIDIAAYALYRSIEATVTKWLNKLDSYPTADIPATDLLRSWYTLRLATITPDGEDQRDRTKLEGWKTAILDILDPPTQIPYMGQACPICSKTRARRTVEGDIEETVALWAFLRPAYREEGSYGLCKACDTVLATDADPITLRRKMNGTLNTGNTTLVHQTKSGDDTAA